LVGLSIPGVITSSPDFSSPFSAPSAALRELIGSWVIKASAARKDNGASGSLDSLTRRWNTFSVTLTLDLEDLRSANEKALAQLGRTSREEFDAELAEVENFLLSIYRFAVLAVRGQQKIERAAEVWRETLEVINSAAKQAQALSAQHPGLHPSLDRILEIRSAASDMLAACAG
jgi:hypothetical protein